MAQVLGKVDGTQVGAEVEWQERREGKYVFRYS